MYMSSYHVSLASEILNFIHPQQCIKWSRIMLIMCIFAVFYLIFLNNINIEVDAGKNRLGKMDFFQSFKSKEKLD